MNKEIAVPTVPRSPWQRFYGSMHALRWHWWSRRAERLPRPVISIGNLHWGGTGKTPVVAAVAAHLRDRGRHVAILSRGYRSRGRRIRVVSSGEGPLLGPIIAGDEPVLLAGELPGVAILVGPDRAAAGRHALARIDPSPELFLLDDGFSHVRLFRDVDILTFPADDPWGGSRLPPSGRLREPLASVARADAALLIGGEAERITDFQTQLRRFGFSGTAFRCDIESMPARLVTGEPLAAGSRVLVISGIARPQRFLTSATRMNFEIVETLTFPDHHGYGTTTLRKIEAAARKHDADAVLTTSKDRVKLFGRLQWLLAELPIRARPEARFWEWLERRLGQLGDRHD